jgi:hypothetical protein
VSNQVFFGCGNIPQNLHLNKFPKLRGHGIQTLSESIDHDSERSIHKLKVGTSTNHLPNVKQKQHSERRLVILRRTSLGSGNEIPDKAAICRGIQGDGCAVLQREVLLDDNNNRFPYKRVDLCLWEDEISISVEA